MTRNQLRFLLLIGQLWMALAECMSARGQVDLMSESKRKTLRQNFPATEDQQWQQLADDPTTLMYTDTEIPSAYQHAAAGLIAGGQFVPRSQASASTTFHSSGYNISGGFPDVNLPHGQGGNGNIEFPWRNPGGTDNAEGRHSTYRMMWLPKRADGKPWPIVWFREDAPASIGGPHLVWKWVFPRGTIFAEVLALPDSRNRLHTYEVRIRIRATDHWDVDILRPFPASKDLARRLRDLNEPELADAVRKTRTIRLAQLTDRALPDAFRRHPDREAFSARAVIDVLPEMPEALSMQLLDSTPFKSALGAKWLESSDGRLASFAPTTHQQVGIVPREYRGTFVGTDTESCRKCHESTNVDARKFDRSREWYGRIRGNDAIFTFHPIAPSSISRNGGVLPVRLRKEFVESGMVEQFDSAKHPPERYTRLPELELQR